MSNIINNAIGLIGTEIINTIQEISTPLINKLDTEFNHTSIPHHLKEHTDYLFICIEIPGITKEDCKIDFIGGKIIIKSKTNYQITNSNNINSNDFDFIDNRNITKIIDLSHYNINENFINACYINGLLKIKLKKKPKTNINID
jgi:HSP20 family molecular chaperone IbpA